MIILARYHTAKNYPNFKVAICTTPDTCRAPQPSVLWRDRQLKISVFFKGTGNSNVSWSKQRDDGTRAPFNCSAYFPPNHCVLDVLENQQVRDDRRCEGKGFT
eukprot:Em0023g259a